MATKRTLSRKKTVNNAKNLFVLQLRSNERKIDLLQVTAMKSYNQLKRNSKEKVFFNKKLNRFNNNVQHIN